MNFGLEEGLAANGVEYVTIPAFHEMTASAAGSWLSRAREICGETQFDQVWLEIVHSNFDQPFLEWVAALAPVRIGFICESLEIDPGEWINNSEGTHRRQQAVVQVIPYLTHVAAVDAVNVERFNTDGPVPAIRWPIEAVPARYVTGSLPPPQHNPAIFYGTLYGERKRWLEEPCLKGLLVRPDASPSRIAALCSSSKYSSMRVMTFWAGLHVRRRADVVEIGVHAATTGKRCHDKRLREEPFVSFDRP